MTTYTLTGTVNDIVSNPLVLRTPARAFLIPYAPFVVEGTEVRVGSIELTLDATTGAFSQAGLPVGGYAVQLRYYDPAAGQIITKQTQFFNLTGNLDLATAVAASPYVPALTGLSIGSVTTGTAAVTLSPTGVLDFVLPSGGGSSPTLSTKTGNYSMTTSDAAIVANGSSITITLPSAVTAGATGKEYTVKNRHTTNCTVASAAGTIDGTATKSLVQYASLTVVSDGANWMVV
jgi:hypothetical protein